MTDNKFAWVAAAVATVFALSPLFSAAAELKTNAASPEPEPPWIAAQKALQAKMSGPGGEIFAQNCAVCHEQGVAHAPSPYILKIMTTSSIYNALTKGAMRVQAAALSDEQKKAVAEYLGGANMAGDSKLAPPYCSGTAARLDLSRPPAYPGWGLTVTNTRYVNSKAAGLSAATVGKLKLKWAMGFDGANRVRSQPALGGGAIFIGSQDGIVYALDRDTGCARWKYQASAEVRTGIVISGWTAGNSGAKPQLYFGDIVGNVYALDAATGAQMWKVKADPHPSTTLTATPVLFHGKLYVPVSSLEEGAAGESYDCCTFRGSIIAYEARSGARLWQTFMVDEPRLRGKDAAGHKSYGPSGIALWNSPAIDERRGAMYFDTGDNYSSPTTHYSDAVIAMDLNTGKIKWSHQVLAKDAWNGSCSLPKPNVCPTENGPDYDFGAAAMLATAANGKQYVLAGAKSGVVYAFDPANGKLIWQTKVGRGGILAGVYFGMATHGDVVYVPINDAPDGRHYDEPAKPGLYALDIHSGKYLWKSPIDDGVCKDRGPTCAPGIAAPVMVTDDLVLSGAGDGRLRFYAADSGRVVWEYDTAVSMATVGGGKATGGSIGGSFGPMIDAGTLIVPSGYGFAGRTPGNLLLVFDVD